MPRNIDLNSTFAQQVITAVLTWCHTHPVGAVVEAEQVCDPAFWASCTTNQHKIAGRVISEAVERGLLPLIKRGKRSDNRTLYERIGDDAAEEEN